VLLQLGDQLLILPVLYQLHLLIQRFGLGLAPRAGTELLVNSLPNLGGERPYSLRTLVHVVTHLRIRPRAALEETELRLRGNQLGLQALNNRRQVATILPLLN